MENKLLTLVNQEIHKQTSFQYGLIQGPNDVSRIQFVSVHLSAMLPWFVSILGGSLLVFER